MVQISERITAADGHIECRAKEHPRRLNNRAYDIGCPTALCERIHDELSFISGGALGGVGL